MARACSAAPLLGLQADRAQRGCHRGRYASADRRATVGTAGDERPGAGGEDPGGGLWRPARSSRGALAAGRLKITQGLVEPDRRASLYSFAEARALALRCLDAEPACLQRRVELGWEPALEILSPAQRPCAAYGALAWARWMEVHGGAAGEIDLDTIDLLVQAITNTGAERERRVAVWAQALMMAIRPDWHGRDLDRAQALLERAIRVEPEGLVRRADLLFLVAIPLDDLPLISTQIAHITGSASGLPEDVSARERVEAYVAAQQAEEEVQGDPVEP